MVWQLYLAEGCDSMASLSMGVGLNQRFGLILITCLGAEVVLPWLLIWLSDIWLFDIPTWSIAAVFLCSPWRCIWAYSTAFGKAHGMTSFAAVAPALDRNNG